MNLVLPLKGEYFDAIKAGKKRVEYRLNTAYWRRRLERMQLGDTLTLTLGYPPRGDSARRMVIPWAGMMHTTIIHPHFGPSRVDVFAIDVSSAASGSVSNIGTTK